MDGIAREIGYIVLAVGIGLVALAGMAFAFFAIVYVFTLPLQISVWLEERRYAKRMRSSEQSRPEL